MKIIIEEKQSCEEEDCIIIRCQNLNAAQWDYIHKLKACCSTITAFQDNKISRIQPDDVFYIESVDNKVFLYTDKEVYEIRQKLYEIESLYQGFDYFRASKSIIVNLNKIHYLSPVLGSRLEATLINGEKLIISRQYVVALKHLLEL